MYSGLLYNVFHVHRLRHLRQLKFPPCCNERYRSPIAILGSLLCSKTLWHSPNMHNIQNVNNVCVSFAKDDCPGYLIHVQLCVGPLLLRKSISGSKSLLFMKPPCWSILLAEAQFLQTFGLQSRLMTFDVHHNIARTHTHTHVESQSRKLIQVC